MLFFFVHGDVADFFDNLPAFNGMHVHEAGDVSLQDDVIAVGIDLSRGEKIKNFRSRPLFSIDPVSAVAVLVYGPAEHHLRRRLGEDFRSIIKGNFHAGGSGWLLVFSAIEQQVSRFFGAHGLGR